MQIINSDPTSDYHHVRIYVNNHNLYNLAQSISSTPYTNEAYGVRAVMAHEVGHTLGLSHIIANIATVLMEPYATTTYAYHGIYGPTSYDIDGVVAVGY
ncbi:MAG: matrixin family metalloprotease [Oscillospiraceae bacterium]|nr:matrixin family metalloprotease [Oscillospiraceae bacterium]